MPRDRLPADLPTDRVHAALRRLGFELVREGKHSVFVRGESIFPVPRHSKVSRVLVLRELRRIGVSADEFAEAY